MTQYAQEPDKDFEVDPGDSEPELPSTQKVAIVMVALGEGVSGEVMKHLSDYEIEEITQAIAGLKNTSIDVMDRILNEFEASLLAGEWVSQGGVDFARQALERAVGPRKAQEILHASRRRSRRASICCATCPPTRSRPLSATSTPSRSR